MGNLQKFVLKQSTELMQRFSNLLLNFWTDYHVLCWNLDKQFTSFIGSELLLFIKNTEMIVAFLKENFQDTKTLSNLCEGLLLWEEISPFLVITDIEDVDDYEKKLVSFTDNLKKFYKVGSESFLTKDKRNPGGDETFYMHCLRFYLPKIARTTLDKDGYGLGIFTMQGYERRNKESKNTLQRFCNGKRDILPNNMNRLYYVFHYDINAY